MIDDLVRDIPYVELSQNEIEFSRSARLTIGLSIIEMASILKVDTNTLTKEMSKSSKLIYYESIQTLSMWFFFNEEEIYIDIPNGHWRLKKDIQLN